MSLFKMFGSLIFIFAVLPLSFATVGTKNENIARPPFEQEAYYCVLPPHPEHGRYTVRDHPFAMPGEKHSRVMLDISCDTGYINNNTIESILCVNGYWSALLPICFQDFPAATCFYDYNNKLRPASDFVVAVNKMYYKYNDSRDRNSQYSDVVDIKVPARYYGRKKTYKSEDNVAIAVVNTPFFLYQSVLPMVLDFDKVLNNTQLTEGNSGKTIRWSWSEADGEFEGLNATDIRFIKREDCENMLPTYRQPYLTIDKFCMRYDNVIWPLTPDMGNGLFFFDPTSQRYYLRGMSTDLEIAKDGKTVIIMYTSIGKHEGFILEHL